jgi:hypothetical protein
MGCRIQRAFRNFILNKIGIKSKKSLDSKKKIKIVNYHHLTTGFVFLSCSLLAKSFKKKAQFTFYSFLNEHLTNLRFINCVRKYCSSIVDLQKKFFGNLKRIQRKKFLLRMCGQLFMKR